MSYRYTDTDKWNDKWFRGLKQLEMLLFNYLCDNCDIAGFIEADFDKWAFDLHSSTDTIKGACKGLIRGLIFSENNECVFIKNFLKHQKNLPLNENNKAHIGILRRFDKYSQTFDIQDINTFLKAPSKGLGSPTGSGIGNDCINSIWRKDFKVYISECNNGYKNFNEDAELIKTQQRLNPGLNIPLTIEKGYRNFWGTEAGWKNKKATKTADIDWKRTIINSIDSKMNRVYLSKNELSL